MKEFIKHTIECNCVLPQYKNIVPIVFHKFIVFSIINEDGSIKPSYASCNNCGAIHKIIEVGQSIQTQKESTPLLLTINEIKTQLPEGIVKLLESYKCDITTWQEVKFIIEEQKWGRTVILTKENDGEYFVGKYILILGKELYKVDSFSTEENEQ